MSIDLHESELQRNINADLVVNYYGFILESRQGLYAPLSVLSPFTKETVKNAIRSVTIKDIAEGAFGGKIKNALEVGYIHTAYFVPAADYEVMARFDRLGKWLLSMAKENKAEIASFVTDAICGDEDRIREISNRTSAEVAYLANEYRSFQERLSCEHP